jgi:hypothetical protein
MGPSEGGMSKGESALGENMIKSTSYAHMSIG